MILFGRDRACYLVQVYIRADLDSVLFSHFVVVLVEGFRAFYTWVNGGGGGFVGSDPGGGAWKEAFI